MVDTNQIKAVIEIFEKSNVSTMDLQTGDMKIKLKKNDDCMTVSSSTQVEQESMESTDSSQTYHSPLVGTFYASNASGKKPYVQVGQEVKEGDVLCIIEAMKTLNEIKASSNGIVKDILVQDGDLVEFEQPLMILGD